MLPSLQRLIIAIAARKVDRVGEPIHSTKITRADVMTIQPSGRPVQPTIHVIGGVTIDLIMGPVAPWPQPGTETFVAHSELGPAGRRATRRWRCGRSACRIM